VPGSGQASTTIETNTACPYVDSTGKTVFDGRCLVNWGVIGIAPCDTMYVSERYVRRFSPASEAWIYLSCDGAATVNGIPAVYELQRDGDGALIQVLTDEREMFIFDEVSE
jgi:hypothetical protein